MGKKEKKQKWKIRIRKTTGQKGRGAIS